MSCYIGLFETCEGSTNFEYIRRVVWSGLTAVLSILTSPCLCLRTNCALLSPDDHCLRGKIRGEFCPRSWRAAFGELTFQMFALVFITVTWMNVSFSCAREPVVWEIVCLSSWTIVRSCLLDGLKRWSRFRQFLRYKYRIFKGVYWSIRSVSLELYVIFYNV